MKETEAEKAFSPLSSATRFICTKGWLDILFWIILIGLFLFAGIINVINWEAVNGFIGNILSGIGHALAPYLRALPDSFAVPVIALIALLLLYILLRPWWRGDESHLIESFFKLTMAWCSAAFNLGMVMACEVHPHGSLSMVISGFVDIPLTLFNFPQWGEFAQVMFYLIIIGGLIVSVLFGILRGPRSFIRTWIGLGLCVMLGFVLMHIRLDIGYWLEDSFGFLGSLVNIVIGFFEALLTLGFFFGIIIFILPLGVIAAINEMNRKKERKRIVKAYTRSASDDFSEAADAIAADIAKEAALPTYVTDEDGHHYAVEFDGDYLYIRLPYDRIGTKWEYVKGGSYFDLQGHRYDLH